MKPSQFVKGRQVFAEILERRASKVLSRKETLYNKSCCDVRDSSLSCTTCVRGKCNRHFFFFGLNGANCSLITRAASPSSSTLVAHFRQSTRSWRSRSSHTTCRLSSSCFLFNYVSIHFVSISTKSVEVQLHLKSKLHGRYLGSSHKCSPLRYSSGDVLFGLQ